MTHNFWCLSRRLVVILISAISSTAVAGAPLDPTFFASSGIFSYPIGSSNAVPLAIAEDAAGRIFTVGYAQPSAYILALTTRFNASGLDYSFGDHGSSQIFGTLSSVSNGVAIDHHGHAVIVGSVDLPIPCDGASATSYFSVTRLYGHADPNDGQPDTGFGPGVMLLPGTAVQRVGGCKGENVATGIAIDDSDYITTVGIASDDAQSRQVAALARWTSDGDPDTSFGTGGAVMFSYPDAAYTTGAAITSDSAGRLLVGANATTSADEDVEFVARYSKTGKLDTSFGSEGFAVISFGSFGKLCCIAVDRTGKFFVAGQRDNPSKAVVARLDASGAMDLSFGIGGIAEPSVSAYFAGLNGLQIDKAGRPIATGYSAEERTTPFVLTTINMNVDGTLNTALGYGGIFKTTVGFGNSEGMALLFDDSGRAVISGYAIDRDGYVPLLIRYDEMFGDGFD